MTRLVMALAASMLLMTACSILPGDSTSGKWFTADMDVKLATAVHRGDTQAITELISQGADPNAMGVEELTMLQWSVMTGSVDGMGGLLDAGADPDQLGRGGTSPLHDAVFDAALPLVQALLAAGADVDVERSLSRSTPLTSACQQPNAGVFAALLEAGADPDAADANADGAIHTCARTNQGALLLMMLEHGADPQAANSSGATFQDYYFNYPPKNVLNERALAERVTIISWLEDNDVPVIPAASKFR